MMDWNRGLRGGTGAAAAEPSGVVRSRGGRGYGWHAFRRLPAAALLLYSLFVFWHFAFVPSVGLWGDALEYNYMAESLLRHLSPELRESDIASAQEKLAEQSGLRPAVNPRRGFFESNGGQYYSFHFWLYPLFCLPAKAATGALHGNELKAFGITNALLYIAMLWTVFLASPRGKKVLLTGLMLFSPMVPYIAWPHPEVFSASLVAMALVFYLRGKLAPAALLSALASCQNPPIAFFTFCVACSALCDAARGWRATRTIPFARLVPVAFCCLPVFFAPVFYQVHFSTFNLIHKVGAANFSLIGFHKFLSYFFDLNQGAVLYSGLLLFVFFYGLARNLLRGRRRHLELAASVFVLAILSLPAPNWNCGLSVAIRYFSWTHPFVAFYVAYAVDFGKRKLWEILLLANAALLFFVNNGFEGNVDYLEHTKLASKVLTYCPYLYNPEPDIFCERITHTDGRSRFPAAFVSRKGKVTKILADKAGWERIARDENYFIRDPAFYSNQLAKFTREDSLRYINVLHGQIDWAVTLELHGKFSFASPSKEIPGLACKTPDGRWTTQKRVAFGLLLDGLPPSASPLALHFDVEPLLAPNHPRQEVDISVNDRSFATWTFDLGQPAPDTTLRIPRGLLDDGKRMILRFHVAEPRSPAALGLGDDSRKLGICLKSIELLDDPE